MKTLYLFLSIFVINISDVYSQDDINVIANYVNDNCENCNQVELNTLVIKLCKQSDSILISYVKRFDSKYFKEKHIQAQKKNTIKENYHNSYRDLIETRKKTLTRFAKMNTPSTVNDYNRGILYLYMNQNIMSILAFMETSAFGDFFIEKPVWEK